MTLADEKALFEAVWRALKPEHPEQVRMVVIDNTLHLEELWVSEALAQEIEEKEGVEVVGEPFSLHFDSEGLMQLRTSVATEGADELSERRCQKIFAGLVHISRRCACSGDASGRLVV
jgi:hypothetical protein